MFTDPDFNAHFDPEDYINTGDEFDILDLDVFCDNGEQDYFKQEMYDVNGY